MKKRVRARARAGERRKELSENYERAAGYISQKILLAQRRWANAMHSVFVRLSLRQQKLIFLSIGILIAVYCGKLIYDGLAGDGRLMEAPASIKIPVMPGRSVPDTIDKKR
uniref:hypothetical protein n=1 Tax=Pedobacter schmidteae TaxID=2201271 RepID=UPI000EAF6BAE|nr:hypothetical protein [Pedobacter schmidteae]